MAAPKPGEVIDGYRFKGGNPNDKGAWESAGPKPRADWGPGAQEMPDGSIVRMGPKGGATVLHRPSSAAAGVKPTEDQGKGFGYAQLMTNAEASYDKARQGGYNPGSIRNTVASVLEGLPFGGLDGAGAMVRDDLGDQARQAELQWSDAQLKAMSGAASPEAEVKRNVRTYFPRPGENIDSIDPQKHGARVTAYENAKVRAGPLGSRVSPYPAPLAAPKKGAEPGVFHYDAQGNRIK